MFKDLASFRYSYAPILALSPSEMTALEELPDKDKDIILPIIPIKGWSTSKFLKNSAERVKKSISNRFWIADIDAGFLSGNRAHQLKGEYPREVFYEIENLLDPEFGYKKWYEYLKGIPEAIPTIQLQDIGQLGLQFQLLESLNRGVVVKFSLDDIESDMYRRVLNILSGVRAENVFIIYDLGTIDRSYLDFYKIIRDVVNVTSEKLIGSLVAISATSFPSSFSGWSYGENSIYERALYNKISQELEFVKFIYSDHGSARVEKQNGGGGIPAPRIDYPLKNDWRFIRKEFEDSNNIQDGEKEKLYHSIAKEMILMDYWVDGLHLWGTQMIELTSQGDKFSINSPQKATAVRINIHMYNQLHYNSPVEDIDTDEDWID